MNNIFIHITAINNYINILNDFKNKIETSGLIHDIDRVYLCVSGKNELISDGKYEVLNNGNNLLEFEFPTLDRIKYHCKNNDGNILYLHMKGISDPNNKCLIDWRNYMMYFLVEKYKVCLESLKINDTCGVDLRIEPTKHYSGNFWWATSDHINSLPEFKDMEIILSERHKAEFWICNKGKNDNLWNCGINQFERHLYEYPRERYNDNIG